MSHGNFTLEKLFSYKDCEALLRSSAVVYRLTSSCSQNYIGQNKGNPITCFNQHCTKEDSEVSKHFLNNPNLKINFDPPKVLHRNSQATKLRIKETQHISITESQLNVDNHLIFDLLSF